MQCADLDLLHAPFKARHIISLSLMDWVPGYLVVCRLSIEPRTFSLGTPQTAKHGSQHCSYAKSCYRWSLCSAPSSTAIRRTSSYERCSSQAVDQSPSIVLMPNTFKDDSHREKILTYRIMNYRKFRNSTSFMRNLFPKFPQPVGVNLRNYRRGGETSLFAFSNREYICSVWAKGNIEMKLTQPWRWRSRSPRRCKPINLTEFSKWFQFSLHSVTWTWIKRKNGISSTLSAECWSTNQRRE